MDQRKADLRLDLRGRGCPYPTMDTCRALDGMAAGELLEVISDYYPAKQTIPGLMQQLGYPCRLLDRDKQVFRIVIRKVA